jgi:hypothetical protein
MHGWQFYDDQHDSVCVATTKCGMVVGPDVPMMGSGSAELATQSNTDGVALLYAGYGGTRFDSITTLKYSTYRQSADPGNDLAIALQMNVDYDLSDNTESYQGRLVFEPYQGSGGGVNQGVWQTWDAKAGKWWGTKSSVPTNGVLHSNPCVQATPCTWSQLLAAFPNVGVHRTYGAVVLKAGSGWSSFRGNVDGLTIAIGNAVTTYDFELSAPALVTLTPPDSVPGWIYSDTNLVDGTGVIAGKVAKNVVIVAFDTSATSTMRSAALSHVAGTVVGGVPLRPELGGFYFVRVNAATPAAVLAAADSLTSIPGIALAIPAMNATIAPAYRTPTDGPGATSWKLDPMKADSNNWALESIGAPMAWGCSTGSAETHIAVLDDGYFDVSDLRNNVGGFTHWAVASDTLAHGTFVASILGAEGNNHDGVTGVMWSSTLQLYDISMYDNVPITVDGVLGLMTRLGEAAVSGARVINVSREVNFHNSLIPATPDGQAFLDKSVLPALRWVLRLGTGNSKAPLFVFAAGNGDAAHVGREAKWAGFPIIEAEFPSRVLVVAATRPDSMHTHLASFSNFGPLVQIAAPGERVMGLDRNDLSRTADGTSAAAPLVSGVAGLLASFDPSLTTSQIRDFIVAGALQGGQYSDGMPYLNAYESLKLAASRVGAPLCGNRIWYDGSGNVVVERGSATETIIQRDPNDYLAFVEPYHGGKRIDLGFSYEYDWDQLSRSFIEVPWHDTPELPGAAWTSWANIGDHDGQMWVKRVDSTSGNIQVASVKLLSQTTGAVIKDLGSVQIPGTMAVTDSSVCGETDPVDAYGNPLAYMLPSVWSGNWLCVQGGPLNGVWDSGPQTSAPSGILNQTPVLAVPAPQGDAIYVPVSISRKIYGAETGLLCDQGDVALKNDYIVRTCGARTVQTDSALRAFVYRIDTATGVWATIPLRPGNVHELANSQINSLEVSEDGKEIMLSVSQRVTVTDSTGTHVNCHGTLEWISVDNSATPKLAPGTVIRSVIVPPAASCGGLVEAGGTISPTRIANHGPQLMPATTRVAPKPTKSKPNVFRSATPRTLRP